MSFHVLRAESVFSISSGSWFNPLIWSSGKVPGSQDDVEVRNGHTVNLFGSYAPQEELELCGTLSIQYKGILITGHNNQDVKTIISINGNFHCDGVYYKGDMNTVNPSLKFNIENENLVVDGNGYLKANDISFNVKMSGKSIQYSHQFTVCENDFFITSLYPANLIVESNAYISIKGSFALAGKYPFSTLKSNSVNCIVDGIIVTDNIWLITPDDVSSSSSLILNTGSAITTSHVNANDVSIKNKSGIFQLSIEKDATLRLASGSINPLELIAYDNNLRINTSEGARVTGIDYLEFPNSTSLLSNIDSLKPINSDEIESNFANVYSATHIAGWYNFTDKPFLIEGVEAMKQFGTTNIKLAFSIVKNKSFETYPFNHVWPDYSDLVEMAKDPYWVSVFSDLHYKTFTMWVSTRTMNSASQYKKGAHIGNDKYWDEEDQFYKLAKHLLLTYPDKEFVFQNWEGDWMLRGSGVLWENDPSLIPANVEIMLEGMRRMFMARQRGIERARREVAGIGRVMFAVEANKLFAYIDNEYKTMMELNTPSLVADVFPHMRLDMVSWSSYDGIWFNRRTEFPIGLNNGIDIFESYMNPTRYNLKKPVMLGEIGFNENLPYRPSGLTDTLLKDYYERLAALARYKNIFAYFLWNLYCSGEKNIALEKGVKYTAEFLTPYMDGKWVIKPNGSLGFSGQKFISFKNKLVPPLTTINEKKMSDGLTFSNNRIIVNSEFQYIEFTIFSVTGVPLIKFKGESVFDMSGFNKGVYIIKSTENVDKKAVIKVIIN